MTFSGALTIVIYSLKPYWPLIALLILILAGAQWAGRNKKGATPTYVAIICLVVGIAAALLAPAITLSQLGYVQTTTDILSLGGVAIGSGIYTWLVLSPLSKTATSEQKTAES